MTMLPSLKSDLLKLNSIFPIINLPESLEIDTNPINVQSAVILIKQNGLERMFSRLVFNSLEKHMLEYTVKKFWSHFRNVDLAPAMIVDCFWQASVEVDMAVEKYQPIFGNLNALGIVSCDYYGPNMNLPDALKFILKSSLNADMPAGYNELAEIFCRNPKDPADKFTQTCQIFSKYDLLTLLLPNVISCIQNYIDNKIKRSMKDECTCPWFDELVQWLDTDVMVVYEPALQAYRDQTVSYYREQLLPYLKESYLRFITDQLFYIIIDYPGAKKIINDVRKCLRNTDVRPTLVLKLQQALQERLLQQSVSTPDILTAYIQMIRALRRLDPSGVLLDAATEPVRTYLRTRKDAIRCVVSSLTEGTTELADELAKGEVMRMDDAALSDDENDNWEYWYPDPVDADPKKVSKSRRTSDIISLLVNVFGSKELFVNEYRILLADRLLAQTVSKPFCIEKELFYLELLKTRFGDAQLQFCEVMLKDIHDSKKVNAHLDTDMNYLNEKEPFAASALILSAQFWPPFKEETMELCPQVQKQFDLYTKGFEAFKGSRSLNWKPHLGSVDLEIEFGGRTLNLTVAPMLATIILHFETKTEWPIDELSKTMKVPTVILRRRLAYWQSQGIIQETAPGVFKLAAETSEDTSKNVSKSICDEEEETESALTSPQDQWNDELQIFWSYIVGMLTNLESMSLERIHQMLTMFVSQGAVTRECSLQELYAFLDEKVKQHKLVFSGGLYKLIKN